MVGLRQGAERFTILGANGFIGSRLVQCLVDAGHACFAPERDDDAVFEERLDNIIYCVGLTADTLQRPFDAMRAHVSFLIELLERAKFSSLLYLSSTRLYAGAKSSAEDGPILTRPMDASDYFNVTKLAGEAACAASGRKDVRIARLSNVYGEDIDSPNFLPTIIRSAIQDGYIVLRRDAESAKDYVSIHDVVSILPKIAVHGTKSIYNVASGIDTSNREIVDCIAGLTGCGWEVLPGSPGWSFPPIETGRLTTEFDFSPSFLLKDLPHIMTKFQQALRT
jgi:nucleoside-diphosphate-sugar epimerase